MVRLGRYEVIINTREDTGTGIMDETSATPRLRHADFLEKRGVRTGCACAAFALDVIYIVEPLAHSRNTWPEATTLRGSALLLWQDKKTAAFAHSPCIYKMPRWRLRGPSI